MNKNLPGSDVCTLFSKWETVDSGRCGGVNYDREGQDSMKPKKAVERRLRRTTEGGCRLG